MRIKNVLSILVIVSTLSGIACAQQATNTLLMVSPNNFKFNKETAQNNLFQKDLKISNDTALQEFNSMVNKLKNNHVRVIVMPSRQNVETPDSIFPNNWFSIHSTEKHNEKILIIYPMFTKNRRLEVQPDNLINLLKKEGININKIIDFSPYANKLMFLEGTGSLVLDRENKIAYAAISPRTNLKMVNVFAKEMNYKPVVFHSFDENNQLIYHTNVMMSVGSNFAVVALDSISNKKEGKILLKQLYESHKEIIPITLEQVKNMAGNILEVRAKDGKTKIIMSESAYNSFTTEQRNTLTKYGDLISVNIKNIETVGGGSARCMLAEIF
ncbi:MAG: citrulline utilization hydrolase CtlX [Arsenophonus sp. NEOnobi-MAG3]